MTADLRILLTPGYVSHHMSAPAFVPANWANEKHHLVARRWTPPCVQSYSAIAHRLKPSVITLSSFSVLNEQDFDCGCGEQPKPNKNTKTNVRGLTLWLLEL